ncbi:MAG TPA: LysR family transcriptional regulator [Actinospica sp.]|nr:LysR family transcriptional regulator [Actinospica sp.]
MNLAKLDLNLVLALDALLEERSVTRAGRRVGLSQPAMSAALARLRRHFGDELLARTGNSYELTPLGAALRDRTAAACELLERVFASQADFDASVEEREFTLLASDYAMAVFGSALARAVAEQAPGIRLTFRHTPQQIEENTAAVLSTVDGLFMPHGIIGDFPAVELYRDTWVFVVSEDNPDVGDELTLDDLGRLPWAVYQRTHDAAAARQLSMLGVEPRVQVSTDSFHVLPSLVAGTRRVALLQRLLAARLGEGTGVRVMECPFDTVLQEAMWWHPVHTHDAGHLWLRETAASVGAGIRPLR